MPAKGSGRPVLERFLSKVELTEDCWLWTGRRNKGGYGVFDLGDGQVLAHRLSYELHLGPVPPVLDHLCRVHHCVRPMHLEGVTHRENNLRGFWGSRTHCKNGHEFNEVNTRMQMGRYGHRFRKCRVCERIAQGRDPH